MIDWQRNARQSTNLYNYFNNEINSLPGIFDKVFFGGCLSSVKKRENNGFKFQAVSRLKEILDFIGFFDHLKNMKSYFEARRDRDFVIPDISFIIRAIVVSRWIKLWF